MIRSKIKFDHCVIQITDWETSNTFYQNVLGAEIIPVAQGFMYRLQNAQLNVQHVSGFYEPLALRPVQPGNTDFCLEWQGTVEEAKEHLEQHGVKIEMGPVTRFGSKGTGTSLYFRDPDGSLLEFIVY
jgi:catechol 2,3-dioxygenase-like lactoylglutathione lyase family enzyme